MRRQRNSRGPGPEEKSRASLKLLHVPVAYSIRRDSAATTRPRNIIGTMTFNTKARMTAYLNYMSDLDGSVWSLPEGDTCEN